MGVYITRTCFHDDNQGLFQSYLNTLQEVVNTLQTTESEQILLHKPED